MVNYVFKRSIFHWMLVDEQTGLQKPVDDITVATAIFYLFCLVFLMGSGKICNCKVTPERLDLIKPENTLPCEAAGLS